MFAEHWPFWLGALALAGVSVAFLFATGSTLGVSSSYTRLVAWRESRAQEEAERAMPDDEKALEAMLIAATLEQFGDQAGEQEIARASVPEPKPVVVSRRLPLSAHALFLGSMFVGGALAAVLSGSFSIRWDMGTEFASTFGWLGYPVLVVGGALVGFGTAMAGGCTSGHGLSGCGRIQPASLVATSIFFGAGVLVSIALSLLG